MRYISAPWELDNSDLIIIPGSNSAIADLVHLKETGLAQAILDKARIAAGEGLFRGLTGECLTGYEVHMGQTLGGIAPAAFEITERVGGEGSHPDGAVGRDGMVFGTYLHGLFDNERFRRGLLHNIKPLETQSDLPSREEQYEKLAMIVRQSLDMGRIYQICDL